MNTTQLKDYAPKARNAFIAAVSAQAARFGVTAKGVEPARVEGDVLLVGGQAFPADVAEPRERLARRVKAQGFQATMEAVAYTWFNRFVAIRYMELHGYLDHGYRVLSHPEGQGRPEILDHAADVDLTGLNRGRAVELKLDGTKDEELYRLLLEAQCNALHRAMPFLFERIGDETQLLLPANLLHTDSLIRRLVEDIDESAWEQIEIIGWLYQFYISEKKEQVIGKVVKSEDIPAATQLFTPNWIVKYMVQNSLGAQWLATYPQSPLKGQMDYYIEPAAQTDEVTAQLAAITPSALNPEELTLIDPACGSGHILVEAYELFKAIYLERGYRQRDVPQLILEKNLFGLDIDERAAQLTGFALMMKGRADDRRLFERGVKLNVMALVDSAGLDVDALAKGLGTRERVELLPGDELFPETRVQPTLALSTGEEIDVSALRGLVELFEHATTFGSLIQVPEGLAEKLPALEKVSEATSQDLFVSEALKRSGPLVRQAELLAARYDAVVANPPYMGGGGMNSLVKKFVRTHFPAAQPDLFACFMERGISMAGCGGHVAMVTMQSWMFLPNYQRLRDKLYEETRILALAHLGPRAFDTISGDVVSTTAFSIQRLSGAQEAKGFYVRLIDGVSEAAKSQMLADSVAGKRPDLLYATSVAEISNIPGKPLAYWLGPRFGAVFRSSDVVGEVFPVRTGLQTGDNDRFVRLWTEVDCSRSSHASLSPEESRNSSFRWFPLNAGGSYRRWFGNNLKVVDWQDNGRRVKEDKRRKLTAGKITANNSKCWNEDLYFQPCVTWTRIKSRGFGVRICREGSVFDMAGSSVFPDRERVLLAAAFLNSKIAAACLEAINPTVTTQPGDIARFPWYTERVTEISEEVRPIAERAFSAAVADWDAYERSWDFQSHPLVTPASAEPPVTLRSNYSIWIASNRETIAEVRWLDEENNRLFIDAYGLQADLAPDVRLEQVTLTVNPAYRYGDTLTEDELWRRFRQDTVEELASYAIGCMMGRYSLDAPGLIYAHSGNAGFDPSRYTTFPADDDGIVPLTDTEWFDDDACHRLIEFVSVAWDAANLEDNLTFLAENLSPKKNEPSRETLRRYLCDRFFKDHKQTYNKRPIYWLFSSGKHKAFQCLVYLHRYNEGTLSRMRSEYVIPLQGKMAARLEKLQGDIRAATSTAQSKRLEKEHAKLVKQQAELLKFDEKLRHYADMRIALDLDDGVKVNYGKFGDLLAEVKDVHGAKAETA